MILSLKKLNISYLNISYLDEIKPFIKDIINNFENSVTRKLQLTIAINFIYSKDTNEKCLIHSKSNNIEIMIYKKADKAIQELYE